MKFIPIIFIALIPTFVLAGDLITNDIIGGCGDVYSYSAEFEPISYTCSSGQYLPAGAISCQSCPDGYTCNGGTFSFNANETQGLDEGDILVTNAIGSCSPQFNQSFSAIFEPNTISITWDDGTNVIQNTCEYDDEVTIPPTPTKPGYVFSGWKVKEQPVPAVP